MPLPQHFETATLMINGRSYQLRNCRITDYGMTAERDAVMGFRGMRGMTAPRLTETVTLEAELLEPAQVDERDASRAAAYNGTFSNAPPAEPITMATIEAAARSIQRAPVPIGGPVFDAVVRAAREAIERDTDRFITTLAATTGGPGLSGLDSDDVLRERVRDQVMGSQATTWASQTGLMAATGADLDAIAAQYGVEREPAKASLKIEHPMLLFKEAGTPEPLKTALDWLLEDEGEAA